ncbi:SMP-30/gluconolactonase/LRE family protein [uncultured Jatrophihabitans sp.]|uniref:SMP-30/gluconolactonase/LRE family protein n=1 Tax=uncultured Jatrophihabitans sp. TaxID=1610747 RepID=UPI0035CB2DC5
MLALRRLELPGIGPEDVVLDADGRILAGVADGRILRVDPANGAVEEVANTGGRPLGLEWCADGRLLACDAELGLLQIDIETGGTVTPLVIAVDGVALNFASNVVEAPDGTIYFTASTRDFDLEHYLGDLLEHAGTGRLFRRDRDGLVQTLLDGLHFANGVALAPDGSCVVVAETGAYRLTRYWLTGERTGAHDVLIDNLPGFPDNISLGSDGLIWVTLAAPRDRLLDLLLPRPGFLRQLVWLLPDRLKPAPKRTVHVVTVSFDGQLVHDLQAAGEEYSMVTGVVERGGVLYLGSLHETAVAVSAVGR